MWTRRSGVAVLALSLGLPAAASRGAGAERAEPSAVPLFEGLGGIHRPVTTTSPEAQRYVDQGLAELREAVAREDQLRYDEPPSWIQPVRHALGAALMQSGRFAEAEGIFREDLAKLPNNGWGLYGLARSLELQRKKDEAAEAYSRFDAVWTKADIRLKSACLCQPGV